MNQITKSNLIPWNPDYQQTFKKIRGAHEQTQPIVKGKLYMQPNTILVGGFNPFEKY